jgi:sulfur-oxidizing protein SoxY
MVSRSTTPLGVRGRDAIALEVVIARHAFVADVVVSAVNVALPELGVGDVRISYEIPGSARGGGKRRDGGVAPDPRRCITIFDSNGGGREMDGRRRDILRTGGGLTLLSLVAAAGWLRPGDALAADWNKAAFETKSLDETVKALGGTAPAQSKDVVFTATPDIAENGAVVPIGVASAIPKTESIAILIEKNPNMLAATFDIPPGTDPAVTTRVKMGQSSNVYALVKADGKYYVASKEIKVTLGGCGG